MSSEIKRIAVFSSGGDAPGMNAAIRAVVRTAVYHDLHVYGIYRGYEGLIDGELKRIEKRDVANIIHRGGTILKTARSKRFLEPEWRKQAFDTLQAHDIDAVIAIGGDGTFTGAKVFGEEYDMPMIGIPGTIDNDLCGTDYTIGFDTAVNTAIEAVDRIRDTADSHNRLFLIEVMGRHSGAIALNTGIGSGAGGILIPEAKGNIENLFAHLKKAIKRKKLFSLIICAEGNKNASIHDLALMINDKFPDYEVKITIIGHLQRGGAPSAIDRLIASRMGFSAVEALLAGRSGEMVGIENQQVVFTPFGEAISKQKELHEELIRMAEILAQ